MDLAQPPGTPLTSLGGPAGLRRRHALGAALAALLPVALPGHSVAAPSAIPMKPSRHLPGMVWQPSLRTLQPQGRWAQLGVRELLVQWSAVDGKSFVPRGGLPWVADQLPDWQHIGREPWAQEVIMGLAGMHDENAARTSVPTLVEQARALRKAVAGLPLRITGWYFPVEIDPTWEPPAEWHALLQALPRPLWVSAYDSANLGVEALQAWLIRWLSSDVGVFFQDGVGVHARTPEVARSYLQQLTATLGAARLKVIAEAFRPAPQGGFRSATAQEFLTQLDAYTEWKVYAFDGPHYLDDVLVATLAAQGVR